MPELDVRLWSQSSLRHNSLDSDMGDSVIHDGKVTPDFIFLSGSNQVHVGGFNMVVVRLLVLPDTPAVGLPLFLDSGEESDVMCSRASLGALVFLSGASVYSVCFSL